MIARDKVKLLHLRHALEPQSVLSSYDFLINKQKNVKCTTFGTCIWDHEDWRDNCVMTPSPIAANLIVTLDFVMGPWYQEGHIFRPATVSHTMFLPWQCDYLSWRVNGFLTLCLHCVAPIQILTQLVISSDIEVNKIGHWYQWRLNGD